MIKDTYLQFSFYCKVFHSHWVPEAVVVPSVADVDPHAGKPALATVLPVGDADGGDDVGVQQIHGPPGLLQFSSVGTRAISKASASVSINRAVGVPKRVVVLGGLARFSTQGDVFCQRENTG